MQSSLLTFFFVTSWIAIQVATELKKRMTELEQRAKGTSGLNSSRLKEMIPEAKKTQVEASKKRTSAFKALSQFLLDGTEI